MSNGAGAFLQGMAGGVGMGLQAKSFNKTAKENIPTAQATEQNWANNATSNAGLPSYGQPAQPTAQAGGGMWSNIQSLIGGGSK